MDEAREGANEFGLPKEVRDAMPGGLMPRLVPEQTIEEPAIEPIDQVKLEATMNDPLFELAVTIRKLTYEQMMKFKLQAAANPDALVNWAREYMGEEAIDVTPKPKDGRRV